MDTMKSVGKNFKIMKFGAQSRLGSLMRLKSFSLRFSILKLYNQLFAEQELLYGCEPTGLLLRERLQVTSGYKSFFDEIWRCSYWQRAKNDPFMKNHVLYLTDRVKNYTHHFS